ncbi:MAG: ATP-dependent DNA ligase [Actinomycetota bacterium]
MLLNELVRTSAAVAEASGRRAKIDAIAALLSQVPAAEVPAAVAFLSGELLQRQIGVGYAALSAPQASPAASPCLTLAETNAAFEAIGAVSGPGAQAQRRTLLAALLGSATEGERSFLGRLLAGDLRQGALEGVMTEAIARAAGVAADLVRRAHQLGGSLPEVAQAALGAPDPDGAATPGAAAAALRSVMLRVGRPVRPMLAASAASISAALERVSPAAVEWKIDGIRIQVHRHGDDVSVYTRTLDDITTRVPEIVNAVRELSVQSVVLDGEAVALFPDGRPRPFQVTSSRVATRSGGGKGTSGPAGAVPRAETAGAVERADLRLTPFFFDILHLDGADLIDTPGGERYSELSRIAPASLVIPRTVTGDPAVAEAFFADAVARGHEGVVVKSLDGLYAAGRRGSEWLKVKPRHTLDLVVLAAEWGHGRRRGWLSNLHLGARDPETGGLVMLGKTFKGLTDGMLAWQTGRLLELAAPPQPRKSGQGGGAAATGISGGTGTDRGAGTAGSTEGAGRVEGTGKVAGATPYGVVRVRPELVVEIAFDGVQTSSRYPGGVALRFARVIRYRPDKGAAEADTIDAVRAVRGQEESSDG